MPSKNIAEAVFKMAQVQPDALAIAIPEKNSIDQKGITRYRKITFKELAFDTATVAKGLLGAGFKRGDRVLMMVPPGFHFFILGFGMLSVGIIPMFIDPGVGIRNLKKCIEEAAPMGFIGITKAHMARIVLGWGKHTIRNSITIGPRLFWGGKDMGAIMAYGRSNDPAPFFDATEDDIAAVIFTSGSTGVPKGVVYTHGNFFAQLEIIRNIFGFSPGEIDLPTFPPFALFNPALGMTSIIPDMDSSRPAKVNPRHIIGPIQQFGVTTMFGSPALIDVVSRYGEKKGIKLPSLRRAISAGAPVPTKVIERFSNMLNPGTEILTPYGATEAMPVSLIGSNMILEQTASKTAKGSGICLGKPVSGVEISVIRITDIEIQEWSDNLLLPIGVVGEIVVKGKNVTKAYLNREESTRLAKIKDGDQIHHRMGDLGYIDDEGNLWFCGRKSHRVKVGEKELYTIPCEHIFNQHPAVRRTALVGVDGKPVLIVEIEENKSAEKKKLKEELLGWAKGNPMTATIESLLFHPQFPVDIRHNAKIIREELAIWAKKQLS